MIGVQRNRWKTVAHEQRTMKTIKGERSRDDMNREWRRRDRVGVDWEAHSRFSTPARGQQQHHHHAARAALRPLTVCRAGFPPHTPPQTARLSTLFFVQNSAWKTSKHGKVENGVYHADQRGSGTRQAAETSVAAAQDSHTDQAALPLGHRALPVPQPDPGEVETRAEETPHVLALPAETVTPFPSEVSKQTTP